MSNKQYIGNAKERTNKFGEIETTIGLTKDNLEFLTSKLSDKGWVNVTLKKGKQGTPYLEFWEPGGQSEAPVTQAETGEELPF